MQLLVIRHGLAGDKEAWKRTGADDRERPLTRRGKREMAEVARGLATVVGELTLLATSPLVRAAQSAAIVARRYGIDDVAEAAVLEPGARPTAFASWLRSCGDGDTRSAPVAVVGHEPHLSALVTWLLTGQDESCLALKKGGACLLDFESPPGKGKGSLRWLMTPQQLRRLGD